MLQRWFDTGDGRSRSKAIVRSAATIARGRERGFALVTVVWGMGLIAVLATIVVVGSRYRVRDSADALAVEHLSLASEAAVNLAVSRAAAADAAFWRNPRFRCRLPDGTMVTVSIVRETGKVDLNTADETLLRRLFGALEPGDAGSKVAGHIVAFRTKGDPRDRSLAEAYAADGRSEGPKGGPFISTRELDQVLGVTPTLFRRAMPYVTVNSKRPVPDYAAASPDLLDLLGIARQRTSVATRADEQVSDATIRAIVSDAHGGRNVTEALVSFGPPGRTPIVREWSRGSDDGGVDADADRDVPVGRSCLP